METVIIHAAGRLPGGPFDWDVGIGGGDGGKFLLFGREWQCKMYRGKARDARLKLGQFALRCESNVVERMKSSVSDTFLTLNF